MSRRALRNSIPPLPPPFRREWWISSRRCYVGRVEQVDQSIEAVLQFAALTARAFNGAARSAPYALRRVYVSSRQLGSQFAPGREGNA